MGGTFRVRDIGVKVALKMTTNCVPTHRKNTLSMNINNKLTFVKERDAG